MAKRYIVKFGAVGAYPQGTILTDKQVATFDADRLAELEDLGALGEATPDELKAADAAAGLPVGTAKKAATLAPDSPALATGQPGGAPLQSGAAQTAPPSAPPEKP